MKRYLNERGAALILTLLLTTLALLFILTLFYQILNTTKQVDTMDDNVRARHVAEMGLDYYEQIVHQLSAASYTSVEEFITLMPKNQSVTIDSDRSFKVTQQKVDTSDSDQIVIHFKSEGIAFERNVTKESKIRVHVQIERESGDDHETPEAAR